MADFPNVLVSRVPGAGEEIAKGFNEFFNIHSKTIASAMIAEFNRRKNAYELSKTSYRKSGSIDISRLHSYKTSDDIFKRTARQPKGCNHGVIMVIDWSGSMQSVVYKLAMQMVSMVRFYKACGIKFRVILFTSRSHRDAIMSSNSSENFAYLKDLHMFEVLNHTDSISHLQSVYNMMCMLSRRSYISEELLRQHKINRAELFANDIMEMGGTPLCESKIAAYSAAVEMKAQYDIENMNIVYITDGDGSGVRNSRMITASSFTDPYTNKTFPVTNDQQLAALNTMIRTAGISVYNIYVEASDTRTISNMANRNGQSKYTPVKIGDGAIACNEFIGYNTMVFMNDQCFPVNPGDEFETNHYRENGMYPPRNKDKKENESSSMRSILKKNLSFHSRANAIGNFIVKELCKQYSL